VGADGRGRWRDEPLQRGAAQGRDAAGARRAAPTGRGARVSFDSDGASTVTDGPFAEAKEVVGGYWVIQARSKEEAVEWASRCPGKNCTVEVRRVFELEDFPQDVQEAAETA
jgi:hypothetical protein